MEKKVKEAAHAINDEKKALKDEEEADEEKSKDNDNADAKKKKEENKYPTDPALDVEIISNDLKEECAGNYRRNNGKNAIQIHDHPVWIKVKPHKNRVGYYQDGHWIITDLSNLPGMVEDSKKDPKKEWDNALATSINKVEFFKDAKWNDGKNDLLPHKASDDKIETRADSPTDDDTTKPKNKDGKEDKDCHTTEDVGHHTSCDDDDHHDDGDTHFHDDDHDGHHNFKPKDSGQKAAAAHDKVK